MTRRPGERRPPGGHAEERRRQFERERGLTEPRELDLDEEDREEGADAPAPPNEEESSDDEST